MSPVGLAKPIYPPTRTDARSSDQHRVPSDPHHPKVATGPRHDPHTSSSMTVAANTSHPTPCAKCERSASPPSYGTPQHPSPTRLHQTLGPPVETAQRLTSAHFPTPSPSPLPPPRPLFVSPSSLPFWSGQWSLPQTKSILTTWTILASLLASTSTSMLSFYRNGHNTPQVVLALTYAAIGLEIWGAVVAGATMVAGISLESAACTARSRRDCREIKEGCHDATSPTSSSRRGRRKHPEATLYTALSLFPGIADLHDEVGEEDQGRQQLSPRALGILDNLTLTCGYLIPFAALLELSGLVLYAYSLGRLDNGTREEAIAITLSLTLGVGMTIGAIVAGAWASRDRPVRSGRIEEDRVEEGHHHQDQTRGACQGDSS